MKTVMRFGSGYGRRITLLAETMFAQNSNPFSVPTATVIFSHKISTTNPNPANNENNMVMMTKKTGQYLGHSRHFELPSDRLSPGLQAPHNIPVWFRAHCVSGLVSRFNGSDAFGGMQ